MRIVLLMAITDFTIIKRSLVGRMFSTVTTVITVAVAVGLMLVLVSMQESSQRALSRGSGNAHLYLSQESNRLTSVLNGLFYFNPPQTPVPWEKYEQVVGSGGLPLSYAIPIQQGDTYRGAPVTATTNDFFTKFSTNPNFVPGLSADKQSISAWELSEGRFLEGAFEIVAGAEAAKSANLKVGSEIHLTHGASDEEGVVGGAHEHHEFEWKVVGILKPTGSAHDHAIFTDLTASWIVHAHDRRERELDGHFETTEKDLLDEDRKITGIIVRAMTRPGRKVSAWKSVV